MAETAMPEVGVRFEGLGKRFAGRWVLRGVSGEAMSRSSLAITGPNGAGKSTLLRMIAGLLRPTEGTVAYAMSGRRLAPFESRAITGYCAPDLSLYRELSGAENLRFFARLQGVELSRPELSELLDRVGLKGRGRDLVGAYSSGMRQRLKLAFAMLHRPPVLLLDEPTANLDKEGERIAREIVRDQASRGIVVVATNEAREAEWCSRAIRLGDVGAGSP